MSTIVERTTATQRRQKPSDSLQARASRRARARLGDRIVTGALWGLASILVGVLASFILYTVIQGLGVLSWKFVTTATVTGETVGPQVFNSFYILILALLICIPLGLGGAIYLEEYARQNSLTTVLRFATETLAGIPSIILGLFGFLVFVTDFGTGTRFGFSRLAGALTLVLLNLPLMLRIFEDALRSVPPEIREASYALGATRSQTIFKALIPTALPQLTTSVILTAGKMIGETAALIYTAGSNAPINGWFSLDPLASGETLTVHLYQLQAEGLAHNARALENGTAALLIIFLLVINLGLRWAASAINRRLSGRQ
ncbi:MAG TPA: phosphate ABC transporter permease PstA [Ktedonobacterales bacterium]